MNTARDRAVDGLMLLTAPPAADSEAPGRRGSIEAIVDDIILAVREQQRTDHETRVDRLRGLTGDRRHQERSEGPEQNPSSELRLHDGAVPERAANPTYTGPDPVGRGAVCVDLGTDAGPNPDAVDTGQEFPAHLMPRPTTGRASIFRGKEDGVRVQGVPTKRGGVALERKRKELARLVREATGHKAAAAGISDADVIEYLARGRQETWIQLRP